MQGRPLWDGASKPGRPGNPVYHAGSLSRQPGQARRTKLTHGSYGTEEILPYPKESQTHQVAQKEIKTGSKTREKLDPKSTNLFLFYGSPPLSQCMMCLTSIAVVMQEVTTTISWNSSAVCLEQRGHTVQILIPRANQWHKMNLDKVLESGAALARLF